MKLKKRNEIFKKLNEINLNNFNEIKKRNKKI